MHGKLKAGRTKVRVWVKTGMSDIPYTIEVEDINNPDEIRETLKEKDPSEWDSDPCFYEFLGSNWGWILDKMTDEEILDRLEHPVEEE